MMYDWQASEWFDWFRCMGWPSCQRSAFFATGKCCEVLQGAVLVSSEASLWPIDYRCTKVSSENLPSSGGYSLLWVATLSWAYGQRTWGVKRFMGFCILTWIGKVYPLLFEVWEPSFCPGWRNSAGKGLKSVWGKDCMITHTYQSVHLRND